MWEVKRADKRCITPKKYIWTFTYIDSIVMKKGKEDTSHVLSIDTTTRYTASTSSYPLFCLSEIFFSEWTTIRMIMISGSSIIIKIIVFILFAILSRRMRLHTLSHSRGMEFIKAAGGENWEEERKKSRDVSCNACELNNGKTLDHLGTPIVLQKHKLFCSNSHHSFNTKGWL